MHFSSYILGCGGYVPKKILTNNDLSKKLDTNDEWIKTRTGINQRHIADKKQLNSDLGFEAAKKAMDIGKTKYTAGSGTLDLRNAICLKIKRENKIDISPI